MTTALVFAVSVTGFLCAKDGARETARLAVRVVLLGLPAAVLFATLGVLR